MGSCDSCGSKDSCPSASAGGSCGSPEPESLIAPLHEKSSVKKVIGVCSGKGGVGKSFVTSVLASRLARDGYRVAILDADVTGPSIPNEEAPVVWRGPVISGVVKQFWSDVIWENIDVMLIDMPPGTGDVPLTVFQSIPLDGIFLVSTPQDLVSMIVNKARNMALLMQVKVLGFVENMSYTVCKHCGEKTPLFGEEGKVGKAAQEMGVPLLDKLPLDPDITALVDEGHIEKVPNEILSGAVEFVEKMLEEKK